MTSKEPGPHEEWKINGLMKFKEVGNGQILLYDPPCGGVWTCRKKDATTITRLSNKREYEISPEEWVESTGAPEA